MVLGNIFCNSNSYSLQLHLVVGGGVEVGGPCLLGHPKLVLRLSVELVGSPSRNGFPPDQKNGSN